MATTWLQNYKKLFKNICQRPHLDLMQGSHWFLLTHHMKYKVSFAIILQNRKFLNSRFIVIYWLNLPLFCNLFIESAFFCLFVCDLLMKSVFQVTAKSVHLHTGGKKVINYFKYMWNPDEYVLKKTIS